LKKTVHIKATFDMYDSRATEEKRKKGREPGTVFENGYHKKLDPKQPQLTRYLTRVSPATQSANVEQVIDHLN
jgi:hypothetical protein